MPNLYLAKDEYEKDYQIGKYGHLRLEYLKTQKKADLTFMKKKVEQVLETLTPREAEVLRMRFGLRDGSPKTLEEVGYEIRVTRERVRQIEAKALRKLRHPSRSKQIKDF